MPSPDRAKLKALMTAPNATALPWSLDVEEYDTDKDGTVIAGLIQIPEVQRVLHDTDWAESEEWSRDLANAELIVAAVNALPKLLAEIDRLQTNASNAGWELERATAWDR